MADSFKFIFLKENIWITIKSSLKCVPKFQINNIPALAQIMIWRRPGHKPLTKPMMFVCWRVYASFGLNVLTMHCWGILCGGNNRACSYLAKVLCSKDNSELSLHIFCYIFIEGFYKSIESVILVNNPVITCYFNLINHPSTNSSTKS